MNSLTSRGGDDRDHVDQLIGAYALDALDDVERAAVERHLRTCPVCATEAAELLETAARLGAAEAAVPPPALRGRVLNAAGTTTQRAGRSAPARTWTGLRRLVVAASAVLVLAGAVGGTWWAQQRRLDRERARVVAAEQQTALVRAILTAPDSTLRVASDVPAGRVTAVYSASRRAALFGFAALGPVPSGKTYQLWRVAGGVPSSVRVLPTGQTAGTVTVEHLDRADRLAISVENAGGAARPTDVYAVMALT